MSAIFDFGVRFVVALQGWGNWLSLPMKFFSFLGTEDFFMLVLPALFWCVEYRLGLQVGFMLLTSASINDSFKFILHMPRPFWYSSQVRALSTEISFGAPSNHAQVAAGLWGVIAARIGRAWAWLVAALLVFFIGLSRLYLGMHFPHDVLLGWLLGGLLLGLLLKLWDPAVAWLKKRSAVGQVLIGLAASLLLLLPTLLAHAWLQANWTLPQAWLDNAALALPNGPAPDPLVLDGPISNAGILFGLVAGLVWLGRLGGFKMESPWWKLALRYLLGVAGVFILRYGLKAIFPEGPDLLAYSLRYLRYALIGLWVTGGAPWTFLRTKLAVRQA
jgi:membrane-associated phospholipid phosphatase